MVTERRNEKDTASKKKLIVPCICSIVSEKRQNLVHWKFDKDIQRCGL